MAKNNKQQATKREVSKRTIKRYIHVATEILTRRELVEISGIINEMICAKTGGKLRNEVIENLSV